MNELLWFVAHTRPRREKKLARFCQEKGIQATLACYRSSHKYRGKTVEFEKPLFPGYVFMQLFGDQRYTVIHNDNVANLLVVHDQITFNRQLGEVLTALQTNLQVFLAPEIGPGSRVRIRGGPLQGMEGWVEERYGPETVLLRLDFIGQAAAVKLEAEHCELI